MPGIRGLYIGPSKNDIEEQSRAFKQIGGEVVRVEAGNIGAIIEAVKDVDVAMSQGHRITREIFEAMDRCKGVVSFGHGFDGVDVGAATENGIILANTASFGTEEVSNHTLMMLLVCARKFVLHNKLVKSGTWTREHLPPMGHISGQTLSIIGAGNIGRAVGRKARALGMRVLVFDPYVASWDIKEYGFEPAASLEEACEQADYLTLHTFLNDETYHMIGREQLALMKPTAYVINCSRGKCVDEPALIDALRQKRIAGAGLDVFEQEPVDPANPLLKMDNVAVTSHYASYSEVAWSRAQTQMGEEAVRIATGTWPMSLINPQVAAKIPFRPPAQEWPVYLRRLKAAM